MPQATLNFEYVDKRTINALYENCLCFTALEDNFVLSITRGDNHSAEIMEQNYNFYYSLDNGYTWSAIQFLYDADEEPEETISIPSINNGNKILIRGYNNTTLDGINFSTSKKCNVSGNIMTLLDYDTALTKNSIPDYCFYQLFIQTKIVDASTLILPNFVSPGAYVSTFEYCRELIVAPTLPATTLAQGCYAYMFRGCRSLVTAPALPATTLAQGCYAYMFYGCILLATAPALPATTLTQECYTYMFWACTSLTIPPALPATELALRCYRGMFLGCSTLVQPPALPATTLAISCYDNMFSGCTSMRYAPYLPADYIPDSAYTRMFRNCTSLNYINIHATQRESNSLDNWVDNVAPTGTFVKHPTATYPIDSASGVPIGWTVYNDGDDIPNYVILTVQANDESYGVVTGGGSYMYRTNATFQAYPNDGYNFSYWEIDGTNIGNANPMTMQMTEDTTVTAVFVETIAPPQKYTVTLSISPSGTQGFRLVGAGEYNVNSQVNIACYNDSNPLKEFDKWYLWDGSDYILASEEDFFTIILTEDVHYVAFTKDITPVYYYIYAGLDPRSIDMGSITGTGDYVKNSTATLCATPNIGYSFVQWIKDGNEILMDNPLTITVDQSHQYLAYIRPTVQKYDLIIENNDPWHSDILVFDEGIRVYGENIIDNYESDAQIEQINYSVAENATVTLRAENRLADLLEFDGWYIIDDEYITTLISSEQIYSFVMNGPKKICCKWRPVEIIDETDYSKEYFTITALDDCAVYADIILYRHHQNSMSRWIHHTAITYTLEYSINGGEWQQKLIAKSNEDSATETTVQVANLAATDKMRIRCIMPWEYTVSSEKYIIKHVTLRTASILKDQYDIWPLVEIPCRISGNLLSLVYGSGFLNNNTLEYNYLRFPFDLRNIFDAYNVVFPILSDPSLNNNWENRATYYSNWANYIDFDKNGNEINKRDGYWSDGTYYYWPGRFSEILSNNTYMIKGPKSIGPNTYEGDYEGLLKNNHNLYNAPLCPAEIIAPICYDSMLQNCHSLQKPIPVLPALELQSFCYNRMYERCYILQDPGILPANILAPYAYQYMYAGCRSMMTGPVIPIETLNINNASSRFHLMFGDCINMSFLEVHFKYREGGDFGLGYFLGYPEWYKEDYGGDDPEGYAKENLARMPQQPGRFYRYANTPIDSNTGRPWMSRESLAWYGTEFPDNWTFEDIQS